MNVTYPVTLIKMLLGKPYHIRKKKFSSYIHTDLRRHSSDKEASIDNNSKPEGNHDTDMLES